MRTRRLKRVFITAILSTVTIVAFGIAIHTRVHAAPQAAGAMANGSSEPAPVRYYSKATVDGQFENDKLFLDRGHNGQFYVETSRRIKDGEAELHQDETDVFYVLKGSATVVYGGKMDGPSNKMGDGRPLPAGQIHAKGIIGGTSQMVTVGDEMIIPSGQPHQFTKVQAPFWYLVVKVRNPGAVLPPNWSIGR